MNGQKFTTPKTARLSKTLQFMLTIKSSYEEYL